MKRYKLKKLYPGCPKGTNIGDMVKEIGGSTYYKWEGTGIAPNIPYEWVENFPEYWELVVEKQWEILSFEIKEGTTGEPLIYTHKGNDSFEGKHGTFSGKSIWYSIQNESVRGCISSIKRLSDGEIFSVGDTMEQGDCIDNIGKITCIEIVQDMILLSFIGDKWNGSIFLKNAKKTSKPKPFITENGVESHFGDKVYGVTEKYDSIWSEKIILFNDKLIVGHSSDGSPKWFSTEEKAKEYIYMNKPVFSVQDIRNEEDPFVLNLLSFHMLEEAKKRIKL